MLREAAPHSSKGVSGTAVADGTVEAATSAQAHALASSSGLPSVIDWRLRNVVSNVQDQGPCQYCWVSIDGVLLWGTFKTENPHLSLYLSSAVQAYAAVAAVESKFLISRNLTYSTYPIALSVQQVIDCTSGNQGCANGGGERWVHCSAPLPCK